jgi:hypothetical protein
MRKVLALAALAIPLALAGCAEHERYYYSGQYAPAYERFGERGFHDGLEAGRHDASRGWRPDIDRHGDFRNPPVDHRGFREYRHGFHEGYERAYRGGRDGYRDRDWR